MNRDRRHRWTITAKDSTRENAYFMTRPGDPPGWFPEKFARQKALNFNEWGAPV
jgi:hypothetical protein